MTNCECINLDSSKQRLDSVHIFSNMTGLKHLRVRGMPQVRLAATMKATGLNILRIVAFKNRVKRPKKGNQEPNPSLDRFLGTVKEQFRRIWSYLGVRDFCHA